MERPSTTPRAMRRRLAIAIAAALSAVTLTACGPGGAAEATEATTATAARPAATPATGSGAGVTLSTTTSAPATTTTVAATTTTVERRAGDIVGFSLGLASLADTDDELARDLDAIVAAGARWLRIDVDWSAVEAAEGQPDWSWLDRAVAFATERNLSILGLVTYTPAWARPRGTSDKHPPDDPETFGRFAGQVAGRYAGHVKAWEIWNEPNSRSFWAPQPDAVAYASLLASAATAIRAVSGPGTTIVTGGLAPAIDAPDGSEVAPDTFLRSLLAVTTSFDAVGSHPYSFPALPSDPSTAAWNSFLRLPLLRRALADAGVDRPVWITEFGAPTGTGRGAVSDERQAEIVVDGLRRALELGFVDRLFLFTHRDSPGNAGDVEAHFGLLRLDGTPKPAYEALTAALRG